MTLREFINHLTKIVIANPEAVLYEVVASIDDEGNGFNPVHFEPSLGHFTEGEFYCQEAMDDIEEDRGERPVTNAICVN